MLRIIARSFIRSDVKTRCPRAWFPAAAGIIGKLLSKMNLRTNYYGRTSVCHRFSPILAITVIVIDAAARCVSRLSWHARNSTKKNAISTPSEAVEARLRGCKKRHSPRRKVKVDLKQRDSCKNWSNRPAKRGKPRWIELTGSPCKSPHFLLRKLITWDSACIGRRSANNTCEKRIVDQRESEKYYKSRYANVTRDKLSR